MKIKLILLVMSLIVLSCSSDDDTTSDPTISLVGNWKLISATGGLPLDINADGTFSSNLLDELPCFETTIVVNEDDTYTQTATEVDANVDISNQVPVVTASCTGVMLSETGTWSLEGNKLTISATDLAPKVLVIELTATTLSFTDSIDDFGDVALVFERQ